MKLKLFSKEIHVTDSRDLYNGLRLVFAASALRNRDSFAKWYAQLDDCHVFADSGAEKGRRIITKAAQQGVDYLIERGHYDLTTELFISNYLAPYLTWPETSERWETHYDQILEDEAQQQEGRRQRREGRSRVVGGGFGISGAAKGMALAGVANVGWGLTHRIANGLGNMASGAARNRKLAQLLNDSAWSDSLSTSIMLDCFNVHFAVFDVLRQGGLQGVPEFLSNADVREKAERLKANLMAGKIPESKIGELLPDVLEGNPYDEEMYLFAMQRLGDADGELERYGQFHGIDVSAMKAELIRAAVEPLLGRTLPTSPRRPSRSRSLVRSSAVARLTMCRVFSKRLIPGHALMAVTPIPANSMHNGRAPSTPS